MIFNNHLAEFFGTTFLNIREFLSDPEPCTGEHKGGRQRGMPPIEDFGGFTPPPKAQSFPTMEAQNKKIHGKTFLWDTEELLFMITTLDDH